MREYERCGTHCCFFDWLPQLMPVYEALKARLEAQYPEMTVKVTKNQISFCSRYVFAMVSLPYRRMKDWPKEYLRASFGLNYQKDSPRIVQAVEAYPNRWTNHVIESTENLDDELFGWLDEEYRFPVVKQGGAVCKTVTRVILEVLRSWAFASAFCCGLPH